ncbi:MAG TPA: nucleoside transporter C-terminal domain-containing protein [Kiritimatiellia bacterium]|nr:nucleoside transporter C-terminal domain-containing protein [Kiritimatiellia bacterium]HMO99996.1 nucleoside transporter C-terminal domain-containing protein [Kiritimatiellia bacterium]HMP97388.1 nucleoside transporter C-terminal domain-containing protein [Kiritimatiellia bacterium]
MNETGIGIVRGLLGIGFLLLIGWALSENRRVINRRLVASGVMLQLAIAFAVLKVGWIRAGFEQVSRFFVALMDFSRSGAEFLFGGLMDPASFGFIFAFQVLPTIVFFSALTSALYYLNLLQYLVYGIAWIMHRTMRLSGAESLAAAANIFVGQTEAPLVVKPYLEKMTDSEIMALMTGGMATIAGAVLVAYVGILGGNDPVLMQYFATHLLVASIISAPAALLTAKMMVPETREIDHELLVPRHRMGSNLIDALTRGGAEGVKLAVNVAAMLLVFTAMIALVNYLLHDALGSWTGLNERIASWSDGQYKGLSLQLILGFVFAPVAWLIGVPSGDLLLIGQLLGEKTVLNEFYAYVTFGQLKDAGMITSEKSILIATYALCGFANFASIGIQVGGISALAPGQRETLARLGFKALVGGTIAALMTACVAGMLI